MNPDLRYKVAGRLYFSRFSTGCENSCCGRGVAWAIVRTNNVNNQDFLLIRMVPTNLFRFDIDQRN